MASGLRATTMMFKGLEALKYIHDNYGPGCGTAQVGRAIDIMSEKQSGSETAQEYGTRLLTINATLLEKIPDSILKQIFLRGVVSFECRKWLLGEMSSSNITFLRLVAKAREYDMQEHIANNVDGLNADVRRAGRNNHNNDRNGRNGNGNRNNDNVNRNNGNGNRNNGGRRCDFCDRPNHTWRQCFLLMLNARPANANHDRMNAKRDELLNQCNAPDKKAEKEVGADPCRVTAAICPATSFGNASSASTRASCPFGRLATAPPFAFM